LEDNEGVNLARSRTGCCG